MTTHDNAGCKRCKSSNNCRSDQSYTMRGASTKLGQESRLRVLKSGGSQRVNEDSSVRNCS